MLSSLHTWCGRSPPFTCIAQLAQTAGDTSRAEVVTCARFSNSPQVSMLRNEHGIRVTVWITAFVNVENPLYDYAKQNGFLLNKGKTVKWYCSLELWLRCLPLHCVRTCVLHNGLGLNLTGTSKTAGGTGMVGFWITATPRRSNGGTA
jgi:hypothetical protein